MTRPLMLRLKWTLRAHGKQIVLVKRRAERPEHVLMKAFIWALYLPVYPDVSVEVPVGDRYKPDVVSLDERGVPRFWGEAGEIGTAKIHSLIRRYPTTHLAIAKWDADLSPVASIVTKALTGRTRVAPIDLLRFPADSDERFVDDRGVIRVTRKDIDGLRLP